MTKPVDESDSRVGHVSIFAVSDSTGDTAERLVRAALTQYEDAEVTVVRRGHVDTDERVRAVMREACECGAAIIYTLVSAELRRLTLEQARLLGVEAVDLMGPVLERLSSLLGLAPLQKPGLMKQLVDARTQEVEAVEFAFRHDDGQRLEDLGDADIVLTGISRTMKTPTTLYLAYRGWFAANVPITMDSPLPAELIAVPADRVFFLEMSANRLVELRRSRASHLRLPLEPYASMEHVRMELMQARDLCNERGWQRVDVTNKSVEEVSREILTLVSARRN